MSGCEMKLGLTRAVCNCVTSLLRGHCKVGVPSCKRALKQCWLSTAHPTGLSRLAFCVLYFCGWCCTAQQQQGCEYVHKGRETL